ncbi:MAG TPA: L-threonylcarbamoyladenylate synthase [Blastocatellia bacterium]|nr:L-threonylcarbamoyladenylate synthase [Blastocatellia bacterium]
MTQVIQIDPARIDSRAIEQAARIIRGGGLVAFPTETVYGLGADATSERAVQRIFEAKRRPADNPLIAHVSDREMLDRVASGIGTTAERLIERFWPGPLTIVLKRKPILAESVSAGLDTVAVRMPDNRVALELIQGAGVPLAAPSANRSGRPSPTTAEHVLRDLEGRVDMIIDGGATNIGIESTVIDMTVDPPVILRPGWITRELLIEALGQVSTPASIEQLQRSPGTRHRHYSPRARVILVEQSSPHLLAQLSKEQLQNGAVGFIGSSRIDIDDPKFYAINLESSAADYARSIYGALRELDRKGARVIVIEGIDEDREGAAVMDRLRRAASEIKTGHRDTESQRTEKK